VLRRNSDSCILLLLATNMNGNQNGMQLTDDVLSSYGSVGYLWSPAYQL
jgi:hypothetical protein